MSSSFRRSGTYQSGVEDGSTKRVDMNVVQRIFQEFGPNYIKEDLYLCLRAFDFFFTGEGENNDYFVYEKLAVFFILYSSAKPEVKQS
jgi:hypothetical protein